MPKQKTKKAAAKRVQTTGTGKLTRRNAARSHNLEKKSKRRKRKFVVARPVANADENRAKKMLGLK